MRAQWGTRYSCKRRDWRDGRGFITILTHINSLGVLDLRTSLYFVTFYIEQCVSLWDIMLGKYIIYLLM